MRLRVKRCGIGMLAQLIAVLAVHAQSITPVFTGGQDGYPYYRIPALVTTTNGVLLAVADGRSALSDIPSPLDLVMKRSFDNGRTWSALRVIADYGSNTNDTDTYPAYGVTGITRVASGDAALLVDRSSNRVWVLYDNGGVTNGSRKIKLEMRYSDDDGATWSSALDIEALNPGLRPATNVAGEFLVGPGNGIQLTRGPAAGRLVFPTYVYRGSPNYSSLIYSDDHGVTWHRGGVSVVGGGESQISELPTGELLASVRNSTLTPTGFRYWNTSTDGGLTWGATYYQTASQPALPDPTCQGSLFTWIAASNNPTPRIVFANAAHATARSNMMLRVSDDSGRTWHYSQLIYGGSSAYSALAGLASGEIGLLFEADNYTKINFVARNVADIPATPRRRKLFVLTGQSNSLGTTNAGETDTSPGSDAADVRIPFFWHNWADATTSIGDSGGVFTNLMEQQGGYYAGSATHWGPEINLGRTLYRAGMRDFGIIKCSRGGGGNSFWLKSSADNHMYQHVVEAVTSACARLTADGIPFDIVGLLYLQGESDSTNEAALAGSRLKTLVDNLRLDLPNATGLVAVVGGIAAAGSTRDVVRSNQNAIANTTSYIDYFSNLDLQLWTASDNLHFNKEAKLRIGERYAQAFFANGTAARQFGQLVFIGDSITQGGNGYPSYRSAVFGRLASQSVSTNSIAGYMFCGSVTGAYQNSALPTNTVNGQTFNNRHEGHFGWRAAWECGRVALPANRYNINNLGSGNLSNWTGQATTFNTADAGTLIYTGSSYVPDTAVMMIGINDLADGTTETQVCSDISLMIDQLRACNPRVRIFLNKVLHTNQGTNRDAQVVALNALLPALVTAKNAASTNSPVWLVDTDTGFNPVTMTYDNVHPNTSGEAFVGDRMAAAMGIIEAPLHSAPPHVELESSAMAARFEGNEIWRGAAFTNGWSSTGGLSISIPATTDLRITNTTAGGTWIEGTNIGWKAGCAGSWTVELRIQFNRNPNGFSLWMCTGAKRIIVDVYADRTQDNGSNTFCVTHNNVDGQFHTFRIAHDAPNTCYHVWRDDVRLTPLAGVVYDATAVDSRILFGDSTAGTFGNGFDVTIDYIRFDQTGAYIPLNADADGDGLPDAWEYAYYGANLAYAESVAATTNAVPTADDDGDGFSNMDEYVADTNPVDGGSMLGVDVIDLPTAAGPSISVPFASSRRNYALWRTSDLASLMGWLLVDGPIAGADGPITLVDTNPIPLLSFYNVRVAMP